MKEKIKLMKYDLDSQQQVDEKKRKKKDAKKYISEKQARKRVRDREKIEDQAA